MRRRGYDPGYSFRSADFTGDRDHESGRECARGSHCASATRGQSEDGTTVRVPARTYQPFCPADLEIITQCLGRKGLPALYQRLSGSLGDFLDAEVLVRVPFGPQVPLRLDVDGLMRHMTEVVCSWHERVASAVPGQMVAPDTRRTHAIELGMHAEMLLTEACPVLAERVEVLLARPAGPMMRSRVSWLTAVTPDAVVAAEWRDSLMLMLDGADAGNEILRVEYLARAALLETDPAPVRLLGVPCRSCDRRMLVRADPPQHDGDPEWHSVCTACRDLMDSPTYAAWVKRNAAFFASRVTPAQAAAGIAA
jgi:hypothetical protein